MKRTYLHKKVAAVALLLLPLPLVLAQEEAAANEEEVFELNPFEVSTSNDMGYYASSSMAGTRINTSLRDVASSIQVVTEEFMEDIGATDLDSIMQYTTATETAGIQGNFVGFSTPAGNQTSSVESRANIGNSQRIRGLGNPDKTRDFFKTLIPFDSYNTNRVDINRGANSFLFGLGSPAGLVNANLKNAEFRSISEIRFRVGEGGDDPSTRAELDFNRVLVDDVLAVRFAALYNDTNFRQRPTFMKDERIYGALTYKPFKNTTIRAHYENVDTDANPADVLLPQENLSMFLDAPDGLARLSADVVENIRVYGNSEGPVEFRAGDRLRNWNSAPNSFHFIWEGQASASNNEPSYARSNGIRGGNLRMPTPPEYWNTEGTSRRPWIYYVKHGNFSDYQPSGWAQRGFVNLDTFDFSKYNLAGGNDSVQRDFENYNISLEQVLFNGKAGFELVFDRQEYEYNNWIVYHAGAEHIFFDINETLLFPDPNGDGLTPMPNPNYGRPAIMTQTWSPYGYSDQDSLRFTGFIQHDFRDHVDGFFGKLLGRHRVTALVDQVKTDAKDVSRRYASFNPDGTPTDMSTNGNNITDNYDRQLFQTIYIGPQQLNAFTDPNFTMADFIIEPMTTRISQDERTLPVTYWNIDSNGWDETTVTGRWVPANSHSLSKVKVTSAAFNSQSHLLDDLVVVNLGWREDEVKQKLRVNDAPIVGESRNVDPELWNLNETPESVVKEQIFGYGIVLNPPREALRLPDWFDISFHYNNSENFVPSAGQEDYLSNVLPPPTGESEDYGFTLYLFDSKLVARVNWFEGALANSGTYWRETNGIIVNMLNAYGNMSADILRFDANGDGQIDPESGDLENRSDELLAQTYAAKEFLEARLDPSLFDLYQFQQTSDGNFSTSWRGPNTTDLHDNETEGLEIEIVANPLPNWRISLSIAKYETVLANVAPRLTEFIDAVSVPFIQEFGDLNFGSPTLVIPNETVARNINDTLFDYYVAKAAEGTRAQEQREWSWNLVTNYSFRDGPLKGFSVGGAYRWQDSYAYGYPLTEVNDIVVPDVANPYMSDTEYNVDLWFGYGRKIFNKSVDWRIQVNIRNVNNWNSDEVTVVRVQPDGSPARARFDPPREIFVTNTFKF
jgi:outer membrane receptor protein involved in Fe transport